MKKYISQGSNPVRLDPVIMSFISLTVMMLLIWGTGVIIYYAIKLLHIMDFSPLHSTNSVLGVQMSLGAVGLLIITLIVTSINSYNKRKAFITGINERLDKMRKVQKGRILNKLMYALTYYRESTIFPDIELYTLASVPDYMIFLSFVLKLSNITPPKDNHDQYYTDATDRLKKLLYSFKTKNKLRKYIQSLPEYKEFYKGH